MAFFKSMWKPNSKHEKLSEELVLKANKDTKHKEHKDQVDSAAKDTFTFKLKYLGSTQVDKMVSQNITLEAVKTIKSTKDRKSKAIPTVNLKITLEGITVTDLQGDEILKVSIYRISNCSTEASQRQMFSFISSDSGEISTCHVFLCPKRKIAQDVTLALASVFSSVYQTYNQLSLLNEEGKSLSEVTENEKNHLNQKNKTNMTGEERLIDLDSEPLNEVGVDVLQSKNSKSEWVSFDDDCWSDSIHFSRFPQ